MPDPTPDAWLFSYGTLRQREVQISTFGRTLSGQADALPGYRQEMVEIKDAAVVAVSGASHHPIVRKTGDPADQIAGTVFRVTKAELLAADAYEVSDYRRIAVTLRSGLEAFVYVDASDG